MFPDHTFNLCNIPPWVIASWEFNDDPRKIEIDGVRQVNRFLFERLDGIDSPVRRGEVFNEFMTVKFKLHEWNDHQNDARRSLRNSYVRYLRGWGIDSNTIEGAVLKGWVESRLGMPPTFHRGRVLSKNSEEYQPYAYDRMRGHARTNAIDSQLDLLYEFCQYEMERRHPGERWLTLYRGTCDAEDYELLEQRDRRHQCVRMNNLSSFTSNREFAWEFGSTVWEVRIPLVKVFFFSGLLPDSLLKGEEEYLVVGGEYWVKKLLY
ncbi:MAG: NAD+---dinitrogen-reductase ADP-D-ribosyltransferase [Puniceicoccaceae bacterium 5H]|nr:MAG: NAD+---dinitrogen-reductase ADP-D-ribosyltransferase [Puniceicoccaceae bacterium 5H]